MRRQKKVQYSPPASIPHYDGHFSIDCFLCDCIILLLDSQCLLRVMTTMSEADIVFRRCMEDSGAFKLFVSQSIWVIIFAPCTQRYVNGYSTLIFFSDVDRQYSTLFQREFVCQRWFYVDVTTFIKRN